MLSLMHSKTNKKWIHILLLFKSKTLLISLKGEVECDRMAVYLFSVLFIRACPIIIIVVNGTGKTNKQADSKKHG